MKKSELVSELNIYKHRRGLRRRVSPKRQIELLEAFLSQPEILILPSEDTIDWQQFQVFVEAHKRQGETFDGLFSEDYLKSETGSADLFLKFKMNFVDERVSSFTKNQLELTLRDYKRGRGLRRMLLPKKQIKLLEGFLSQRSIKDLPVESKISWKDFQKFVGTYRRYSETDSLFSEDYLESGTGSAVLFSKFQPEQIVDIKEIPEPAVRQAEPEQIVDIKEIPEPAVRQAELVTAVFKNEAINEKIFSFLNDRDLAAGRLGLFLPREKSPMKKIWWDRLRHTGLSEELLNSLKQTKIVSNYEFLYLAYKKLSVPFRKAVTTQLWQLLVLSGEPQAIQYAIDEKLMDMETQDCQGLSVIHYAALSGSRKQLEAAVNMGEELKQEDNQDENVVNVRNKLEQKDKQGRNAMHFACWSGQTDVVDYCLQKGLQPKMKDSAKRTGAYYAVLSGSITQVKHIEKIRIFSSIHYQLGVKKESLRAYAIASSFIAAAGPLNPAVLLAMIFNASIVALGAPFPITLKDQTLIEAAIKSNDLLMIKFIGEKYSFDIRHEYQNLLQIDGDLPEFFKFLGRQIEMIAKSGSLELFKLSSELFTHKQILEIRSFRNDDESLLHLAIKSGSIELVDYLVAKFNFVMDQNCVYYAVMSGCPDMLEKVALALKDENGNCRLENDDMYHQQTLDDWAEKSPNPQLIRDKIEELRNEVSEVPCIGGL